MNTKAAQRPRRKKFRKDSYEAALSEKQRMDLYVMLFDERKTLHEIQAKTASWRGPKNKIGKPEIPTLSKIRGRLLLENVLCSLDGMSERFETYKSILGPMAKASNQEKLLDQVMTAISAEVIDRTLRGINPEARSTAARLLLKRADQRLLDRRIKMLEAEFKKNKPKGNSDNAWSNEEKEQAVDQILGIS